MREPRARGPRPHTRDAAGTEGALQLELKCAPWAHPRARSRAVATRDARLVAVPRPCGRWVRENATRGCLLCFLGTVERVAGCSKDTRARPRVFTRVTSPPHPTHTLLSQDDILRRAVAQYKGKNWKKIGACIPLSCTTALFGRPRDRGERRSPGNAQSAPLERATASRFPRRARLARSRARLISKHLLPRFTPSSSHALTLPRHPPGCWLGFQSRSGVLRRAHGRAVPPPLAEGAQPRAREGPVDEGGGREDHRARRRARREAVVEDRAAAPRPHRQAVPRALVQPPQPRHQARGVEPRGGSRVDPRAPQVRQQVGGDRQDLRRPHRQRDQEPLELHPQAQGGRGPGARLGRARRRRRLPRRIAAGRKGKAAKGADASAAKQRARDASAAKKAQKAASQGAAKSRAVDGPKGKKRRAAEEAEARRTSVGRAHSASAEHAAHAGRRHWMYGARERPAGGARRRRRRRRRVPRLAPRHAAASPNQRVAGVEPPPG